MPGRERQKPLTAPGQGAIGQGLARASALKLPVKGGYAGTVDLGLQVGPRSAVGYLETLHRLRSGKLDLAAFAQGWAGLSRFGERWEGDYGAIAGLRGSW
jgi:hypothetical protein